MESGDFPAERGDTNADPANWTWLNKAPEWIAADQAWQDFNTKWYGKNSTIRPNETLDLGSLEDEIRFSSILVRGCYVTAFDEVWAHAFCISSKGTIITGQPGTGKTLLDLYILIRFLQLRQNVLFSMDGVDLFLFYHGTVLLYGATSIPKKLKLPQPTKGTGAFMWSLFDIQQSSEPPQFMVRLPCLPIQTTSPNPVRYKIWQKEECPNLIVLPLWTRDELLLGLSHQPHYQSLEDVLCSRDSALLKTQFPDISEIFAGRTMSESSWEDDLGYLLDEAIYHFGYAARDVYNGIFKFALTIRRHNDALHVSYNALKKAVYALSCGELSSEISHKMLAMSTPTPGSNLSWKLTFKSEWIGRGVLKALNKGEHAEIARYIRFFRDIPQAQQIAGRFLEPFAHQVILDAPAGGFWPTMKMISNDADPPVFTVDPDATAEDEVQFPKIEREVVTFQSLTDLDLAPHHYYIPDNASFPLFDAFTIEPLENLVILWILQMTTARLHGGSAKGYQNIRTIIAELKSKYRQGPSQPKARKRATGKSASSFDVIVKYVLVVPQDEKERKWNFPKGWGTSHARHDHRGDAYYMEIPISVASVAGSVGKPPSPILRSGQWREGGQTATTSS